MCCFCLQCRRAAKITQKPIRRSLPVSESWEILCKKGVDPKYEKQWEGPCDKEIEAIYDHSVEKLKEKGQLDTLLGLHHDHEKMTDFIEAFGAHYDNTDLDWFRGVVPSGKVSELKACLRGYLRESFHKLV